MQRLVLSEKKLLQRYGCLPLPKQGCLVIDWPRNRMNELRAPQVLLRLVFRQYEAGSLFCLATEVSTSRIRPSYSYCPLNPESPSHMKFVSRVLSTGTLDCLFYSEATRKMIRVVIPSSQLLVMKGVFDLGRSVGQESANRKASFTKTVAELERGFRLPELFLYLFPETTFMSLRSALGEAAKGVDVERRKQAREFLEETLRIIRKLKSKSDQPAQDWLELCRVSCNIYSDLRREYRADPESTLQLVSNIISVTSSEDFALGKQGIKIIDSFLELFERTAERSQAQVEDPAKEIQAISDDIRTRVRAGKGISLAFVQRIALLLGLDLRGIPGRGRSDYSLAYELKASGLSWSKVTRKAFSLSNEFKGEFGTKDFEKLTSDQVALLEQRIRMGVASYAQSTGLPYPLPSGRAIKASREEN